MRASRSELLPQTGGIVHKFWRCHNKEFLLQPHSVKDLYLRNTISGLLDRKTNREVTLQAFCIMGNHSHQVLRYLKKSEALSHFMRTAHSGFGQKYNYQHNRTGKVANERPKTPLIQNDIHAMTVHFYVEANPIRAGRYKPEQLKLDRHNSFRFYAYGIVDEFTKHLETPSWYLALGNTREERQKNYRRLFYAYLRKSDLINPVFILSLFIGDELWKLEQKARIRTLLQAKRSKNTEQEPCDSS